MMMLRLPLLLCLTIIFVLVLALIFIFIVVYTRRNAPTDAECTPQTLLEEHDDALHTLEERRSDEIRRRADAGPPEVRRLRDLVADVMMNDDAWDALIAIGDVYRKGAYPRFRPNEHAALQCYRIAARCPVGELAGIAQAKYVETRREAIGACDVRGADLPEAFAQQACRIAKERLAAWNWYERPRVPAAVVANTAVRRAILPVTVGDAFAHDAQNVHDHGVMAATRRNLAAIAVVGHGDDEDEEEVRRLATQYILEHASDANADVATDALEVVSSLTDSTNESLGVSELVALSTVWRRIQSQPNPTLRRDLMDVLVHQLASGVEHGHVVCSTGKIARMMATFDGMDIKGIQTVQPMWAVKEELASLAAKVRDRHTRDLTDADKQAYERGQLRDLEAQMRRGFEREADEVYVQGLGMSRAVLEPMIQACSEAF
jgi:hypothetical protein